MFKLLTFKLYQLRMKKLGLLFFLVIPAFLTFATVTENADLIFLKKHTHLKITQVGSSLRLSEDHYLEKQFYRNFEKYAKENIYYSDFDVISSLEAATKVPFKKKYKTVKVTQTETSDIFQPGIFYGGYKKLHFVYPRLEPNAIGKLNYSKTIKDPHFIMPFYFQEEHFIVHSEYSVTFPKNVKINYQLYGEGTELIEMKKMEEGDMISYQWIYSEVPSFTFGKNAPSRSYLAPHIIILIDSYKYGLQTHSISSGIEDLYAWYDGLIDKISPCEHDVMMKEVRSIITSPMSAEDSIQTVFKWVQKNIKYVAFEDGMAGFIPRSACDVINKRYGDCKDMANLLKALYQTIGVDAHHTWIGTRKKPYSYHSLPSTMTDNHMICSIELDQNVLYLDATNPFSDFGMPTSMIQGKEALIGIDKSTFEISKVPVIEAKKSVRNDRIICRVDQNDLNGSFSGALTGYMRENFQYDKLKAEVKKDEEFLRDHISIGENNIQILNEKLKGIANQSDTGKIHFEFNMPNYCRTIGNKYYINLNLYKQKAGEKIDIDKRVAPMEEEFKYFLNTNIVLDIPDGYKVSYIPENKRKEWNYGYVETMYENKNGSISYYKIYKSDFLLLERSDFAAWNQFLDELSEIGQETVILEKI